MSHLNCCDGLGHASFLLLAQRLFCGLLFKGLATLQLQGSLELLMQPATSQRSYEMSF